MKCLGRFILFSFLLPAACTVTNAAPSSSSACSELADRCPLCTDPGLTQTCNEAVQTNDPVNCQDGLDDPDIQTNCVSTSPGAPSTQPDSGAPGPGHQTDSGATAPDTGASSPQPDSGAPGIPDTGSPDTGSGQPDSGPGPTCGTEVCLTSCPGGHCDSCESLGACSSNCEGGECQQTCEGSASCLFTCQGGGCTMSCLGDATCTLDCPGGGCTFLCQTGSECTTSCAGSGCTGH
jgi:hypothetical protein